MKALVFPSFQGICCQRVNCVDCWSWTSTISVACSMILLSSLWLFVMLSFALRVCSLIRRQVGHTAYALVISSPPTGKRRFTFVFGCECCRVHTEFTHRSSCNTYLITTERWKINTIIMIAENEVILKARGYVKLIMSKLCFGEDSKATCCKRDHCTVCSMNSPPCHSYENQGMHIESTNITIWVCEVRWSEVNLFLFDTEMLFRQSRLYEEE